MEEFIKATKALSDKTRLRILNLLLERECCVCEVMQALDISQTRASRNLGIIHDAGFLKARRDGAWMHYSIDRDTGNPSAAALVKLLKKIPLDSDVLKQDRERLAEALKIGSDCSTNCTTNTD